MARTHSKTVDFWRTYVSERGTRNADIAPPGHGTLFQGGSSKGIDDSPGSGEIRYGSPKDRFGNLHGGRAPHRFKR